MTSTMKKEAKATAVKKGTFYECGWCGKEGTNTAYYTTKKRVICGRMVEQGKEYFCSYKCQHIDCLEHNRRKLIANIDFTNELLDELKKIMADFIKKGDKISPCVLKTAKLLNIFKKVLTFVISGDKPSARKLYEEKKAIVTDYTEDLLADKEWERLYMFFINGFAELDDAMSDGVSV